VCATRKWGNHDPRAERRLRAATIEPWPRRIAGLEDWLAALETVFADRILTVDGR